LFCKLLVIFEELENFSTNQWQGVSTRLKRDTTSDTCTYEDKFQKAFTAKNISNYIINSNVDAIKDDDGRRYFILDLSNKRKGDFTYFNKIYENCMNDSVGEAFFAYLMTVDLTGYHDQDFPTTKAKEWFGKKFLELTNSLPQIHSDHSGGINTESYKVINDMAAEQRRLSLVEKNMSELRIRIPTIQICVRDEYDGLYS
jgi:hypothetical protein